MRPRCPCQSPNSSGCQVRLLSLQPQLDELCIFCRYKGRDVVQLIIRQVLQTFYFLQHLYPNSSSYVWRWPYVLYSFVRHAGCVRLLTSRPPHEVEQHIAGDLWSLCTKPCQMGGLFARPSQRFGVACVRLQWGWLNSVENMHTNQYVMQSTIWVTAPLQRAPEVVLWMGLRNRHVNTWAMKGPQAPADEEWPLQYTYVGILYPLQTYLAVSITQYSRNTCTY